MEVHSSQSREWKIPFKGTIKYSLWNDGFVIDNGPFKKYTNPENQLYLKAHQQRKIRLKLQRAASRQNFKLAIFDYRPLEYSQTCVLEKQNNEILQNEDTELTTVSICKDAPIEETHNFEQAKTPVLHKAEERQELSESTGKEEDTKKELYKRLRPRPKKRQCYRFKSFYHKRVKQKTKATSVKVKSKERSFINMGLSPVVKQCSLPGCDFQSGSTYELLVHQQFHDLAGSLPLFTGALLKATGLLL